jgi:hypothetical protein
VLLELLEVPWGDVRVLKAQDELVERWEVLRVLQEPQERQGALQSAQNRLEPFQEGLKVQNHHQSPPFAENPLQGS